MVIYQPFLDPQRSIIKCIRCGGEDVLGGILVGFKGEMVFSTLMNGGLAAGGRMVCWVDVARIGDVWGHLGKMEEVHS